MINDESSDGASVFAGHPEPQRFRTPGSVVSYRGDEPKKKRTKFLPRDLHALIPLGFYCDYKRLTSWTKHVSRIGHLVAPYSFYSNLERPQHVTHREDFNNPFFDDKGKEWLKDEAKQIDFARRFASYGAPGGGYDEPLRPLERMMSTGEDDPFNFLYTSPVAEVIAAHNVLEKRDSLDIQPSPEVSDEVICKGDFVTESTLRGCAMGGLPGLPSVDFFVFEELTSILQVSDTILSLHRFWNYGASRPNQLNASVPTLETEFSEFFTDEGQKKSARVSVNTFARERELDEMAMLEHVHPDIRNQLRGVKVPSCRKPPDLKTIDAQHEYRQSLFDSQIMLVPNRVRDSVGKTRWVVCSILRIRSRVPGCDPVLALRSLCKVQDFERELNGVVQTMMHLLNLPGYACTNLLFQTDPHGVNLASIGHEANIPLAFFNYLREKGISSESPSVFAADWMGQRIDVYDDEEIERFQEYLHVTRYARNYHYERMVYFTNNDSKSKKNAQIMLEMANFDPRYFFPGSHFRAVPQAIVREVLAAKLPRSDPEFLAFEHFQAEQNEHDTNYFFFESDRAPQTRGYVCKTQATMHSDENIDVIKAKSQKKAMKGKSDVKEEELQCVHYSSKRLDMYSNFAISKRDPYETFMRRSTPYPTKEYMHKNFNTLTVIERDYFNNTLASTAKEKSMQRQDIKNMIVEIAFGHKVHPMHEEINKLCMGSDVLMLLSHMVDVVDSAVTKFLQFGVKSGYPILRAMAQYQLDTDKLDENPPRSLDGETIAQQHLAQHERASLDQVAYGLVNDDAQAARRSILQFNDMNLDMWPHNAAHLRYNEVSFMSSMCSTFEGGWGYCLQICDMGGSAFVRFVSTIAEVVQKNWDMKSPGAGADTSFEAFALMKNEFPKEFAPTESHKAGFQESFATLLTNTSDLSWKKLNGVLVDGDGHVMDSSEHAKNFARVYAILEADKDKTTDEQKGKTYKNIEAAVGQSGSTSRGTQVKTFSTTLNGIAQSIIKACVTALMSISSNTLSVGRPDSVNDGSRVVLVPSAAAPELGCIQEKLDAEQVQRPVRVRPMRLSKFNGDRPKTKDVRSIDGNVVRQNMSLMYTSFLDRIFTIVHRALYFTRQVKSGYGMFIWEETRNSCAWLTTNLRKRTYIEQDKMSRNLGGALENTIFGKWTRSVVQMAFHKRMMQTVHRSATDCETQMQHVLFDAIQTYYFVPHTTTALLSGMQLYLCEVVLCTSVMLLSLMALFYLKLERNCPLHIIALVVRGKVAELTTEEKAQYWKFASFLAEKLRSALVPTGLMHANFTSADLQKMQAGHWNPPVCDFSPSVYLCDKYFDAVDVKPRGNHQNVTTAMMLATSFAADQTVDARACVFWKEAIKGVRVPVPSGKSNDKKMNFHALYIDPYWYNDYYEYLASDGRSNSFGAIMALLRVCDLPNNCSRYEFVRRLLTPWAEDTFEPIDDIMSALQPNGTIAKDWGAPILNDKKLVVAKMFDWAVKCEIDPTAPSGYHPRVGFAVDVLWLVISQALYANEWCPTSTDRVSIVNTRSLFGAAQALLFLFLHCNIPKASVPACYNGGVVVAEPVEFLDRQDETIIIPYRSGLHVDSDMDGTGFLHLFMREPQNMQIVKTKDGNLLLSKLIQFNDRDSSSIGSTVLGHGYVCPFPLESVAHMLPQMPSLMRVFQGMYRQFPELMQCAGSYWTLAMRLFGSIGNEDTLGIFPVALTQEALEEEIPCFTYRNGYCFVLKIDGPDVILKPVDIDTTVGHGLDDDTLLAHSSFAQLPEIEDVRFPAEQLSHAMSGGLVLRDGGAVYQPPALLRGNVPANGTPIPFSFMPILRFQCLLLLEEKPQEIDGDLFRTYQETEAAPLVLGVLHRRSDNDKFLKNGRYQVRYFRKGEAGLSTFDYIFAAECLLRDGREVFYTFTEAQFADCVKILNDPDVETDNHHVDLDRRLRLCCDVPPGETFALRCHYTVSHAARSERLEGTHVRIAFSVKEGRGKPNPVILYADVPLFDAANRSRLHVLAPSCTIVSNLVW